MKCFDSKLSFLLLNDIYIELDLMQPRSKVTISHRVSCSPYKLQRLNRIREPFTGSCCYKRTCDYSFRMIVVDFCRRFAVISKHDTPVPISQIHSFHSHVAVGLWRGSALVIRKLYKVQ